jgi:hypothetical protein
MILPKEIRITTFPPTLRLINCPQIGSALSAAPRKINFHRWIKILTAKGGLWLAAFPI